MSNLNYVFAQLDPRPQGAEGNQAIVDAAQGGVMGIEVTTPALAQLCQLGNIDPQHGFHAETYNNSTGWMEITPSTFQESDAAISFAAAQNFQGMIPPKGATLVTIRPDLDSVGAMAILDLLIGEAELSEDTLNRVQMVAESDTFDNGPWQASELPSQENRWPNGRSNLAAMAACVADFKLSMSDRVAAMQQWLLTGDEPDGYRARVETERDAFVAALKSGEIEHQLEEDVATVISKHRAATTVGYSLAPVIVALNPVFGFGDAPKVKKFTVAQYAPGHVDLSAVFAELSELEDGWGGSSTIGGSPQGVSSGLEMSQVTEIVKKHLILS